jgi:hypothetical protein
MRRFLAFLIVFVAVGCIVPTPAGAATPGCGYNNHCYVTLSGGSTNSPSTRGCTAPGIEQP